MFHLSCKQILHTRKVDQYIRDQLGRASLSVPLNIAEGSGKSSRADRKNYFVTNRCSALKCVAAADILQDTKDISKEEIKALYHQADELSRMLFTMIKSLS